MIERLPALLRRVVCGLILLTPAALSAQSVSVERSSSAEGVERIHFQIEWTRGLKAQADSLGLSAVAASDAMALSGGLTRVEALVDLPSLSAPAVRLVSATFDEIRLPLDPESEAFPAPVPAAEGIGQLRRRPVATVSFPTVVYDPDGGSLRRYRTVELEVIGTREPAARRLGTAASQNPHLLVDRSELADGSVYRVPISESGIYRIDRAFLSALGLDPDAVDPDAVRILGNGGKPLPALNSADRLADLAEIGGISQGGGDGRFDDSDFVVFYAEGPRGWTYADNAWSHYVHPFSNSGAVFVKVGGGPAERLVRRTYDDIPGLETITQTTGRYVVDIEEQVWSREHGSGQDWMSNTIRTGGVRPVLEDVLLPGFAGGQLDYHARVAIASNPRATVQFESAGVALAQRTAPSVVIRSPEFPSASAAEAQFSQTLPGGGPVSLSMRLLQQINEPEAAVDWVRVYYPMTLAAEEGRLRFSTPASNVGAFDVLLTGIAAGAEVWDVTDSEGIVRLGTRSDPAGTRARVTRTPAESPREIVAFAPSAATPLDAGTASPVAPQNLHGESGFPDLVIITPAAFLEAANELADIRRQSGLEVRVATVDEIYNEFSGGMPDMRALRDYLKFLYDRAETDEDLLRYALLFGDGHYDYRGIDSAEGDLSNWVPPYETEESLITDATFTSDDYFGLLDDEEGEWPYTTFGAVSDERVDIGVGRFPVQSLAEARMVVDKIRRYESPATQGAWRTQYTFVADDGPTGLSGQQNDADLHLLNVDQVAELIRGGLYPEINIRKIYAESFERVFLNGYKIPGAKRAVNSALNEGTLLLNYSGHGGPEGLAQEEIFTKADAEALTNRERLAVFVTATCSFGWWDLREEQSGAEALLLNENGGAVALLTTVRLVYTSSSTTSLNAGLNREMNIALFSHDEEGLPRRLGDALRDTKNTRVGLQGNSRKFNLLGDPSMRIGLPAGHVEVLELNGVDLQTAEGRMRALDRVQIRGRVLDSARQPNPAFDGVVSVTVFDAERRVPLVLQREMPTPYYTIREDLIWRGDVQATAGEFEAAFVVPKDISYSDLPGRISAYATSPDAQALGYSEQFLVGGTSDSPPDDFTGPEIRLFLNDTTFVSGSLTPPDAELIVGLYDESGINTVGAGVGHEMLLVLNGNEGDAADISSGFRSAPNSYQRGEVRWPLADLQPGTGSLTVRAWDVLNNSTTAELSYLVAEEQVLSVRNVYNYPNPMNRETRFVFEHNQLPGTPAEVDVRIFSISGRPVRTIPSEEALPTGNLSSGPVQILWNGRDEDGDRVATGIYLYQLRVQVNLSDGARQVSETIEKLAIIR